MTSTQLVLSNPNRDPLDLAQLRKFSPAIFAKAPRDDVSERYGFVPTYTILEHMHKAGFVPVEARNYTRRDSDAFKTTKHLLRFRHSGGIKALVVGDVVPEIVLVNSHDRSSLFNLYGGLFRLACLNGLLVSESSFVRPVVVRHTTRSAEEVVANSEALVKQQTHVLDHVKQMRGMKMSEPQALAFARAALKEFAHERRRTSMAAAIAPAALLAVRRPEDKPNDLWHVYNRVQENLSKGGIEVQTANGRTVRTQAMNAINADLKLNADLWELAMRTIAKASKSSKAAVKEAVPA